ncbi:MAG: sigma 54-interacting transcriptional regulator [Thermotogae bacterium]|nr:sigma 54-interacting transcriptional regulator [Thermotogota bacterium]
MSDIDDIVETRGILNAIHEGIIMIDKDMNIRFLNRTGAELLGVPQRESIGKDIRKVVKNTRLPEVVKTEKSILNSIQRLGDSHVIVTNRVPITDKNGNVVGAASVFRDISEVKELAKKVTDLEKIKTMLNAIIDSTYDGISVVDKEGKGILVNKAYTRLTGLSMQDVLGKPATVDIAEGESVHVRVLKTGKAVTNVQMKVGPKKKDVTVSGAPIIMRNKIVGSVAVIRDTSEIVALTRELEKTKMLLRKAHAKYSFNDIIGTSSDIKIAVEQAKKASATPATILLIGESGTGKELFAHSIHNASNRCEKPFIRINCAALPQDILEAELFGYEEGAFTGAKKGGKKGFFEEASGGTIFLDEIGKISMRLQTKLLRVLQEHEIIRVGSTKSITVNPRIIAATNIDLTKEVKEGKFLPDLYYRLNVIPIYIPPLREHKEDIPLLVDVIIKKLNQEYGRIVEHITEKALKMLNAYDWPGNVRELENIIGRSMINAGYNARVIDVQDIPPLFPINALKNVKKISAVENYVGSLSTIMESIEKETIKKALSITKCKKDAADLLKISIRSLYYKIKKYGLTEGKRNDRV